MASRREQAIDLFKKGLITGLELENILKSLSNQNETPKRTLKAKKNIKGVKSQKSLQELVQQLPRKKTVSKVSKVSKMPIVSKVSKMPIKEKSIHDIPNSVWFT